MLKLKTQKYKAVVSRLNRSHYRRQQSSKTHKQNIKIPAPIVIFLTYTIRSLVIGVGLATAIGTALTFINIKTNENPESVARVSSVITPPKIIETPNITTTTDSYISSLGEELSSLEKKLTEVAAKYPDVEAKVFVVDLDNRAYLNFQEAAEAVSAASTIKVPILVAFLQDLDAGKIYLDEILVMTEAHRAGGSGNMQYLAGGSKFTALEVATRMIVISDNTATNMLIERLGGSEVLNKRFQEWGLTTTAIRNYLPDLEGTNTTSPADLVFLLDEVNQGNLLSTRSRDRLLRIMTATQNNSLIPQGVESEAVVAHKTGDIGTVLADGGIIDMPNGKRYVAAIMVKRPHNHPQAKPMIQEISRQVYLHLKFYLPRPSLD